MIDLGLFGWLVILYWPLEAFMLSVCGGTPGKWLLGIQVIHSNGQKLTFKDAWSRSFRVWWRGMGLCIPLCSPFTMFHGYRCLKTDGTTSWDRDGDLIVVHRSIGVLKGICAVVVVCVTMTIHAGIGLHNLMENATVGYNNDGLELTEKGKYDEALKDFNKAIDQDSTRGLFYFNRGTLYYKMGKYTEALADLNKAISLDTSIANAYANRASTYIKLAKFDLAEKDIEAQQRLGGKGDIELNDLGVALLNANKFEEGIKILNQACTANPNRAMMYLNRGFAYSELKKYKEAVSDLTKAITIDPKFTDAYFNRALIYRNLGQEDLAQKDIAKGKQLRADEHKKAGSTGSSGTK